MKRILKYLIIGLLYLPIKGIAQTCYTDSMLIPVDTTVRVGHLANGLEQSMFLSSSARRQFAGRRKPAWPGSLPRTHVL